MIQPTPSSFALTPISSTATASVAAGLAVPANTVPTERQTQFGMPVKPNISALSRDYVRQAQPMFLSHPRLAPSAVSSEQFLSARSLMAPVFKHNIMATKIAHISNLHAEAPRFRDQFDILA